MPGELAPSTPRNCNAEVGVIDGSVRDTPLRVWIVRDEGNLIHAQELDKPLVR